MPRARRGAAASRGALNPRRAGSPGQGLVEFALALPLLLLILAIVLDAGRMFYGWVTLQNSARIASNYVATHPDQWPAVTPPGGYTAAIAAETTSIDCAVDASAAPQFSDPAESVGSTVSVTLSCAFNPITPFFPHTITAGSTATFPVRAGILAAVPTPPPPTPTPVPTPTPTPVPTPTPGPSASGSPPESGSPSPPASPTLAPGVCIVPTLMNKFTVDAAAAWKTAGFNAQLLIVSNTNGKDYKIGQESVGATTGVWDGTQQACGTFSLTVDKAHGG